MLQKGLLNILTNSFEQMTFMPLNMRVFKVWNGRLTGVNVFEIVQNFSRCFLKWNFLVKSVTFLRETLFWIVFGIIFEKELLAINAF